MDAGSLRDAVAGGVADRGSTTARGGSGRVPGRPSGVGPVLVAVAAVALAAAVAGLVAVEGWRLPSLPSAGPLASLLGTGLLGLAASGDRDDGIAELVADVERVREGEDVTFETDREDGLGDLAEAVEGLAEDFRECERERELQERVIDSAPVGITVADATDPDEPLVAVNERFEELTGYDESECLGRNCRFLQGEDTDEESVAQLRRAIDAEAEATVELRNYRADGTEFWNRVRLSPVENDDGEVTHYVGFQEDVTERVERQAELDREKSLLDSIFEQVPIHLYVKDREGRYERVSSAYFDEAYGWDAGRVIGETDPDIFDDDLAEESHTDDLQVVETGDPIVGKEEYVPDVDEWNLTTKVPWRGPDGAVRGLFGVSQKITERKERERELAQYRQFTDEILDAIDDVFYVLDADGDLVRWNETLAEATGYDDAEIADMHATDFVVGADRDALRRGIANIDEAAGVPLEARFETKGGEVIPFEVVATPLENPDGERIVTGIARDISERRERERQLEAIVENTEDPIYIKDREGRYQFVNEAAAENFGRSVSEIVGETDAALFDEGTVADIRADDRRVVETGEPVSREVVRPIDGDERVLLDYKYPYRDEGGEIIGLMGISRDITERKAAEEKLRETNERLEQYREYTEDVLDAIDDVFYVFDETGAIQRWNDTVAEVTGYDDAEIAEMHGTDFFPEHAHERVAEAIGSVFEGGEERVDAPVVTSDGEEIPYEFVASRLEDPDGDPVLVGVGRDISVRKARERELRATKERMQKFVETSPVGVVATDPEGTVTLWNDAMEDIFGWSAEEVVGEPYPAVPDDREGDDEIRQRVLSGESFRQIERQRVRKDGELIDISLSTAPIRDDEGEVTEVVGYIEDITERKERERELVARSAAMEQSIDGMAILDAEGVYEFVNRAHADIYGYDDPEALLGDTWELCYGDEEIDRLEREVLPELAETGDWRGEAVGRRADGSTFPQELSLTVLDDGRQVCVVRDITERKAREREVERTADLLGRAEEMADLGGWTVDLADEQPQRVRWTDNLYNIWGVDREEGPLTDGVLDLVHPDEREAHGDRIRRATEAGEPWDTEYRIRAADGTERWIRSICEPVVEGGDTVELRGSIQDITDRKEREQELERTKDLLQQAGRIAAVGGWELDLTGPEPEMTWSDELYRLHGISPDTDIDVERAVEFYHPDDREEIRDYFRRAVEVGESYDMEVRLRADESVRWVRAIGEPVRDDDGDVVRVRGSIQDITEQKERELALESLHEATRDLLGVETDAETAELVVETAESVLDVAGVAVYLLDDSANHLDAVACSEGFDRLCDAAPVGAGAADSLLWNTYVTGTPTVFDDTGTVAESQVFGADVSGGLLVPIGDHGVFVVATEDRAVGGSTRQLAETLVATTEAAFDRLASERTLRERDAELAEQNARLRRQIGITDLIRRIDQSLIQAESREAIEAAVCDRLVESDDVAFAWIGGLDAAGERVEPSAWAGGGAEYLDAVDLALDGDEPAARTAAAKAPTVVGNVVDDLQREAWRKAALAREFHSVVSVPLAFEEYFYGVLTVYASEPDDFGDLEREVFAELGENIAYSINAVETQRALHTDQRVELTLSFDAEDDVLGRLARAADCTVAFEGLAGHSEEETGLFLTTAGAPVAAVTDALDALVSVRDYRLVGEPGAEGDGESGGEDAGASALFEVTLDGDPLAAAFVRHGADPRSIRADPEGVEAVVDVSAATDVRAFVEMLGETYPSVELMTRRTVDRSGDRERRAGSAFEALTDRQLEVLRTAYYAGFFEWPRTSTGEDVAEMLDVSQPTVNRHLRVGQQRLLDRLFEDHTATADAD
ncbi:PAS domain S-box protein [Halosimplex pelagicum]|uniref:histidine kinase n=1 Tax=Halosimplex pelagicum TaxID=869886 RepID=A0A7D5PDW1_9EURY|nr:PAS domain S-box protein [Halosimplex pelagicum]QLH80759.1 PAS domain S-box protein [Halosimplex pelagicum]